MFSWLWTGMLPYSTTAMLSDHCVTSSYEFLFSSANFLIFLKCLLSCICVSLDTVFAIILRWKPYLFDASVLMFSHIAVPAAGLFHCRQRSVSLLPNSNQTVLYTVVCLWSTCKLAVYSKVIAVIMIIIGHHCLWKYTLNHNSSLLLCLQIMIN